MTPLTAQWKAWAPQILSLVRIVAAFMFILAGTSKLFAFPVGMPPDGSTAQPMTQVWVGGVLEAFGGALILLGLFTRPVAFLLAGEMAVAYFQFHAPQSFWPTVNAGTPAVLYCFLWLYLSAAGAGPWSLDARRMK
jgi:putative oxidoreductase